MECKTKIVYYNGSSLIIDSDVAASLNLENGYKIKSENKFRKIIDRNAGAIIAIINATLLVNKRLKKTS